MTTFIPNFRQLASAGVDHSANSTAFTSDMILVCGTPDHETFEVLDQLPYRLRFFENPQKITKSFIQNQLGAKTLPAALLVMGETEELALWEPFLEFRQQDPFCIQIPLIFLGQDVRQSKRTQAQTWQAQEIFDFPLRKEKIVQRLAYILEDYAEDQEQSKQTQIEQAYKIPFLKRALDISVSLTVLLVLSPVLLLVALLIKLESPGPIFYISKRVGTGYRIFHFLKFRSMRVNADKEMTKIKTLNQYAELTKEEIPIFSELDESVESHLEREPGLLMTDEGILTEGEAVKYKNAKDKGTFVKVVNDPRVTRVGKFIRNTSIDELPQLINVLRGDMSLVGNRPLPLYEAEKLTTDAWSLRFMAPAGITGLWQVMERGKSSNSEEKRKSLDVDYADNYSIWLDIKILFMTIPALLQQENV